MTRLRRGGYIFRVWKGDDPPRHVHVFRDGELVLKWDLDKDKLLAGRLDPAVIRPIHELEEDGRL